MKVELTNGATVHRLWNASEDTEFLAAFQYSNDAEDFARTQLANDLGHGWLGRAYAVSNHYDGKLRVIRHAPASADTHPKGGDAAKTAAPFMSGAVPKADAQTPSKDQS